MSMVDPAKLRELAETQIALVARVHLRAAADEIERLRADAERLDWLEKRTAQGLTPMMQQTSQLLFHWSGYGPLRAAIDAARKEKT